MLRIIIVIIIFSISTTFGQSYSEYVTKAYSYAFIDNDYKKADEFYKKAFRLKKPISVDLYYAAKNSAKLDDTQMISTYLLFSVENGYANYNNIADLQKQEKFNILYSSAIWDSLIALSKKNYKIFNREYQYILDTMQEYHNICNKVEGVVDLRNDLLTVKHQGNRNTCSVFAATALIENIIFNKYNEIIDLSEAYNYWSAKSYTLSNNYLKETYTSVDGLAGYLAVESYKYGSMTEKEWPYKNTNWLSDKNNRCKKINGNYIKECFTGVPPYYSKIANYYATPVYIDKKDIGQYILQKKKPVLINIFWYFDAVDSLGNFKMPSNDNANKGGHVILLVGYDSYKKTFIFQNSWGKKWGNNGYGTIPEEYIIKYFEVAEAFPYGIDVPKDEKIEIIKASMGISAEVFKKDLFNKIEDYPFSEEQKNKIIYLANDFRAQNKYNKALDVLLDAEKWAFDDYNILISIASVYKQKDDFENAIKYYKKIIEFCTNDKKEIAKQMIKGLHVK